MDVFETGPIVPPMEAKMTERNGLNTLPISNYNFYKANEQADSNHGNRMENPVTRSATPETRTDFPSSFQRETDSNRNTSSSDSSSSDIPGSDRTTLNVRMS